MVHYYWNAYLDLMKVAVGLFAVAKQFIIYR